MVFFVEARRSQLHGSLAVVGVVLTTHQPPNSSPQQVLVTSAVFSTPNDVPSAMHYFCTGHWSRAQKEQQEQGMEKESLLPRTLLVESTLKTEMTVNDKTLKLTVTLLRVVLGYAQPSGYLLSRPYSQS
uniref:Uncharacterized protein n=1 Tax=Cryptococcus bacillisporus CA1280 TaxID=1296109 RepID=A0A0D0TI33_CRYGA|nr:hypothetical protein I312_04701 [Cryptococcus bacillisporus CA1280]